MPITTLSLKVCLHDTISVMKQIVEPKDPDWWASIKKDKNGESDVKAVPCDIVTQVGNLACLCQRENDFNNIIIQAINPDVKNAWYMLFFLRYLQEVHNIQYVRIESVPHRYDFFLKFSVSARYDNTVNSRGEQREIIYLDIKKDLPEIKKILYR